MVISGNLTLDLSSSRLLCGKTYEYFGSNYDLLAEKRPLQSMMLTIMLLIVVQATSDIVLTDLYTDTASLICPGIGERCIAISLSVCTSVSLCVSVCLSASISL